MVSDHVKLEDLVDTDSPEDVLREVIEIVGLMFPGEDVEDIPRAFQDVTKLYRGEFPGYRRCNIQYHDLKHTTDCFLAMARLIHGAFIKGIEFEKEDVCMGLIASLLHDTGYIQRKDDRAGSGAKYTLVHVERSIQFMENYLSDAGYSFDDFRQCRNFLKCTGLDVQISEIRFKKPEHALLGKMLGAADLLGQMGNRTYLERLPFLYYEFKEGRVPGFTSEFDLLRDTPNFWEFSKKRFATELSGVDRYMRYHFSVRYGLDRDLYREAINNNINYLKLILRDHPQDYRKYLRRGGFMEILLQREKSEEANPHASH